MADAQFRYGLRILYSGGAELLSLEELVKIIDVCQHSLDNKIHQALDFDLLCKDINKYCSGGMTRLKAAFRRKYGRDLTDAGDIVTSCPRRLLSVDGFGDRSLLSVKKSLGLQLKKKGIPLPTRWQTAPSFHLEKIWGMD